MQWPSDNLMTLLREHNLCSDEAVAACRSTVKRLCGDLPEFDSVWVDALVRRGDLTSWQAGQIHQAGQTQQASGDPLSVAGNPVVAALGRNTFAAESDDGLRVLRRFPAEAFALPFERARTTEERLFNGLPPIPTAPPSLVLPFSLSVVDRPNEIWWQSQHVGGWTAAELLVRGGRMPWPVVAEIARELTEALSWLHAAEIVHGSLTTSAVVISPAGKAVCVNSFVRPFLQPTVSFGAVKRLEDVRGIAPELIGTGRPHSPASDVCAAGHLLYELLTARPVFLSADPITLMQQVQNKDVADVRETVPDCPEWLADVVHRMTRRHPESRPSSLQLFDSIRQRTAGNARTKTMLKPLPRPRTVLARSAEQTVAMPLVIASLVVFAGLVGFGTKQLIDMDQPTKNVAVNSTENELRRVPETQPKITETPSTELPAPDAGGVVVLQSGQSYHASPLAFAGDLHIETTGDKPATVLCYSPWLLQARQVSLDNVVVQLAAANDESTSAPSFAVDAECDVFAVRACSFSGPGRSENREVGARPPASSLIRWKAANGQQTVVTFRDCVFRSATYGLQLTSTPTRCEWNNVLAVNASLLQWRRSTSGGRLPLTLKRVTQIGADGTLDILDSAEGRSPLYVDITTGESVLAPNTAVVRVAGSGTWTFADTHINFFLAERGNPTVIPPQVVPAVAFDNQLKRLVRLPETQLVADALLLATPQFRGVGAGSSGENRPISGTLAAYELTDYEGPKLSVNLPGADLSTLPSESDILPVSAARP